MAFPLPVSEEWWRYNYGFVFGEEGQHIQYCATTLPQVMDVK